MIQYLATAYWIERVNKNLFELELSGSVLISNVFGQRELWQGTNESKLTAFLCVLNIKDKCS